MEESKNKQLDVFFKEQIQEIPLEAPTKDFTKNVMQSIQLENVNSTMYRPLISKKVWFVAAAAIIALFFIPFPQKEGGMLDKIPIDFSFVDQISLDGVFSGISVSNTTIYALLLFLGMIAIQIFYLKGYFERKIQM